MSYGSSKSSSSVSEGSASGSPGGSLHGPCFYLVAEGNTANIPPDAVLVDSYVEDTTLNDIELWVICGYNAPGEWLEMDDAARATLAQNFDLTNLPPCCQ